VTAATYKEFPKLYWTLAEIRRQEPDVPVIVYDLSINEDVEDSLTRIPGIIARKFDYSKYPPHFNILYQKGYYAWKAAILYQVLQEYDYVAWVDGTTSVYHPFDYLWIYLQEKGFYIPKHSEHKHHHHEPTIKDEINCDPGFMGFYSPKALKQIIKPYFKCAMDKNCISNGFSLTTENKKPQEHTVSVLFASSRVPISCAVIPHLSSVFETRRSPQRFVDMNRLYSKSLAVPTTIHKVKEITERVLNDVPIWREESHPTKLPLVNILGYLLSFMPTPKGLRYLELGYYPNVESNRGKISYQMLNLLGPLSKIVLFSDKEIATPLENALHEKIVVDNTLTNYKFFTTGALLSYFHAPILDETSWNKLATTEHNSFNIIFVSPKNIGGTLRYLWEQIEKRNLLDFEAQWALVFDVDSQDVDAGYYNLLTLMRQNGRLVYAAQYKYKEDQNDSRSLVIFTNIRIFELLSNRHPSLQEEYIFDHDEDLE